MNNIFCPWCLWEPTEESSWECNKCHATFHTFRTGATCPSCEETWTSTQCLECGGSSLHEEWYWSPRCPSCRWIHKGEYRWTCGRCANSCDPFESDGACPSCRAGIDLRCPRCGTTGSLAAWNAHVSIEGYVPDQLPEPHEAIGGSPAWSCPDCQGLVPEGRFRWTVLRMAWLIQQRGFDDLLQRHLILPTKEFFPFEWKSDRRTCREIFRRLLAHAGMSRNELEIDFFDEPGYDGGLYLPGGERTERRHILIGEHALNDQSWLQALLSHEIAHEWLRHVVGFQERTMDEEGLTDLSAVYLGFGCLTAQKRHSFLEKINSDTDQSVYLSSEEVLLGLSLFLALRDESVGRVVPFLPRGMIPSMSSYAGFIARKPDLLRQLREDPSSLLSGVEWLKDENGE